MIWNSETIKSFNYGRVLGNWSAEGVCIDTRKILNNEIFIAFKGEQVDGHEYIKEAFSKGAKAFIGNFIPDSLHENANCWIVDDVVKAIEMMAHYNRNRSSAVFIGVTGSVGKTSVKEALTFLFSKFGKTHSSKGNYNNNLGLPISLASMPLDTEYAVYEMGMRGLGEIDFLTNFVKPDIAIITHVAPVHIELLGSLENIARAKSEIFNSMEESGTAIINGDISTIEIVKNAISSKHIKNVYTYGKNQRNDAYIVDYKQENDHSDVKAQFLNKTIQFILSMRGEHQAQNMLSVLLAAKAAGFDVNNAAKYLKDFQPVSGRGKIDECEFNGKKILLIDEAYNASPESLKSALNVIGGIESQNRWKRRVAILADMYELGESTINEHRNIKDYVIRNKIDFLITVGGLMKNLNEVLSNQLKCKHFDNKDMLKKEIDYCLRDEDIVLVKGSHGTKIYEIVQLLKGK